MFITGNEALAFWTPVIIWFFDALAINEILKKYTRNETISGIFSSLISSITLPLAFLIVEILKHPIKYLFNHPFLTFIMVFCMITLCELIEYICERVKEKLWKMC